MIYLVNNHLCSTWSTLQCNKSDKQGLLTVAKIRSLRNDRVPVISHPAFPLLPLDPSSGCSRWAKDENVVHICLHLWKCAFIHRINKYKITYE